MIKTVGVADVLRSALKPSEKKIKSAIIFGSFASQTETNSSDVDVMIIGEISFGEVVSLISPAQEQLRREINPVVYPIQEFQDKVKSDHHFVNTVIEGKRVFLIGDEHDLSRLGQRWQVQNP
jgi:uncharacterized protein